MEPVVRFRNVTRRFGKQAALDNVSFEVPPGVVFALLGENGAGKTTSIRTMLGLEQPTSGEATVLGMDCAKNGREIRKRTGYVPEQPALYDWMTVDEVGWFTAGFYPAGFQQRYLELTKSFELPLDQKIKKLSKGMRARVSLCLALSHKPELLILDEPTSGLDTLVRRSFLESMVDVAADNRTVILSSHQISEVERVADIVAILHQGKLLVCLPLEQLKARLERWTVSLADGASALPHFLSSDVGLVELDRATLDRQQNGRQIQLLVARPSPDWLWKLRQLPAVGEVEVHVPSLEDIFVTCLRTGTGIAERLASIAPAGGERSEAGTVRDIPL